MLPRVVAALMVTSCAHVGPAGAPLRWDPVGILSSPGPDPDDESDDIEIDLRGYRP